MVILSNHIYIYLVVSVGSAVKSAVKNSVFDGLKKPL